MDKIENKPANFGGVTLDYKAMLCQILGLPEHADNGHIQSVLESIVDGIVKLKPDRISEDDLVWASVGLLSLRLDALSARMDRNLVESDPAQAEVCRKLGISHEAFARHN